MESSRNRRSHRSSRHSRSPSRRREPERRRSSSCLPAAHIASRSSSHRQPENRWTRSQERSSGGAVSPAPSHDNGYQPFDRVCVFHLPADVHCTIFFVKQALTAHAEGIGAALLLRDVTMHTFATLWLHCLSCAHVHMLAHCPTMLFLMLKCHMTYSIVSILSCICLICLANCASRLPMWGCNTRCSGHNSCRVLEGTGGSLLTRPMPMRS